MNNRPDEKPAGKEPKPSRTDQAREVVEEYANDLREVIKKLRRTSIRVLALLFAMPTPKYRSYEIIEVTAVPASESGQTDSSGRIESRHESDSRRQRA
jgi:hypothetical protein